MKPSALLKKALDILPLNGSKLKLGALIALVGQLGSLIPGLDFVSLFQAIISNPTRSGITLAVVGAVHKYLKSRFPEAKF